MGLKQNVFLYNGLNFIIFVFSSKCWKLRDLTRKLHVVFLYVDNKCHPSYAIFNPNKVVAIGKSITTATGTKSWTLS